MKRKRVGGEKRENGRKLVKRKERKKGEDGSQ